MNSSDRIILSAKFGVGKTYFLNKKTKDESLSEKYKFFTVYPVNYSVAATEDVLEYIKRDIILQMHERKELNNIDIDALFEDVKSFVDLSSIVSFLHSFILACEPFRYGIRSYLEHDLIVELKRIDIDQYFDSEAENLGHPNVVVGCTVENQATADCRLPIFRSLPIKQRQDAPQHQQKSVAVGFCGHRDNEE